MKRPDREAGRAECRQVTHPTDRARADCARSANLEDALGERALRSGRVVRDPKVRGQVRLGLARPSPERRLAIAQPFLATLGDEIPNVLDRLRTLFCRKPSGEREGEVQADDYIGLLFRILDQMRDHFATVASRLQPPEVSVADFGEPDPGSRPGLRSRPIDCDGAVHRLAAVPAAMIGRRTPQRTGTGNIARVRSPLPRSHRVPSR